MRSARKPPSREICAGGSAGMEERKLKLCTHMPRAKQDVNRKQLGLYCPVQQGL